MTESQISEIFNDLIPNGKFVQFYEALIPELNNISSYRIAEMKRTLIFSLPRDRFMEIDTWDKMRIIYEYSKLP
jgi:hypothetical protein